MEAPLSLPSYAERVAAGAAARQRRPRSEHATWKPSSHRRSPIDILASQEKQRIRELIGERYKRMNASAFAFLRGSAAVMACDLASQPTTGLITQLGGDAHLNNFGTFASPEGSPVFDCNDFDETLPGPFEWDVKRLATSLVVCAQGLKMGKADARLLAVRAVNQYRKHMALLAKLSPLQVWHSAIALNDVLNELENKSLRRRCQALVKSRTLAHQDHYGLVETTAGKLHIKHPGLQKTPKRLATVAREVFETYRTDAPPHLAALFRHYRLADSAFKVVGVGSVGTFCAVGLFLSGDGAPLLLQAKEALESALAVDGLAAASPNQGQRVVAGQLIMQAVPDVFLSAPPQQIGGRWFYVRRLKDSRLADVGAALESETLPLAATLCGRALARAHARGGDAATIAGYMGTSSRFDEAVADFALAYAKQNEEDFAAFQSALQDGRLPAP